MKKKIIVSTIIIFVLLLIAGGVFWWQGNKDVTLKLLSKNTPIKTEDYKVIETSQGKFLENRERGLKIKVPSGWKVEKEGPFIGKVYLLGPEVKVDEIFVKNVGEKATCGMIIYIYKSEKVNPEVETHAESLKNEISYIRENPKGEKEGESPRNEVIMVDNKSAIKRSYIQQGKVRLIDIEVPISEYVYNFSSDLIINQKCVNEFNKVLETVSIE